MCVICVCVCVCVVCGVCVCVDFEICGCVCVCVICQYFLKHVVNIQVPMQTDKNIG